MNSWKRFALAGLVLAFVLGLSVVPANAKPKKKKFVEVQHRAKAFATPAPIAGANMSGKPGYFFSDTASVLNQGQVMGAPHLTFDTWGSALQIPVGVSYGITDKIMVNVNTSFYTAGGASGVYYLNFGGKYGFGKVTTDNTDLKVGAGLDFGVGPISNTIYGYSAIAFDPYGVCTWTLPDGLQFNGKLGLYIQSYSASYSYYNPYTNTTTTSSISYSPAYFQLDLGAAYPFDPNLTGIAELATNGVVGNGAGGTPLVVGIRTGHDIQFQAVAGLDLGGVIGLFVGGGVVLISQ